MWDHISPQCSLNITLYPCGRISLKQKRKQSMNTKETMSKSNKTKQPETRNIEYRTVKIKKHKQLTPTKEINT